MSRVPLTLKLYALLVLGAAGVVADRDAGMWWVGIALVVLSLSWVLSGSRFGWLVQAIALSASLAELVGVWSSYGDETRAVEVFLPPATLTALTMMLVAAAVVLLLPDTRSYCSNTPNGRRTTVGTALGALFVASLPAAGLSVEPRLPSEGVDRSTPNLTFVGYDAKGPSAFFVGGPGKRSCLVVLEPRSHSHSCSEGHHSGHLDQRTQHVAVWVLPKRAVRASVVYQGGETREARLLDGSDRANVFYTTEDLDDVAGIRAYDRDGTKVVGCPPFC